MGELAIAIPEPIAEDAETVVTALETAALFGARGDTREALRWVRHAATSAGENGRDSRALDLARAAADLTPPPPEVAARPRSLPAPPSRPSALPPPPSYAREAPPTAAPPPLPNPAEVSVKSTRPPPPSVSRPQQRTSGPSGAVSANASGNALPTGQSSRPWPAANGRTSVAPRSSETPRASVAPRASETPRASVAPRASETPAPRESVGPRQVVNAPTPDEVPAAVSSKEVSGAARAEAPNAGRIAARVSVIPGDQPGEFFVRVLANGAALPAASVEAYLILTDPYTELFSKIEH